MFNVEDSNTPSVIGIMERKKGKYLDAVELINHRCLSVIQFAVLSIVYNSFLIISSVLSVIK